jgi:energy-converting hydrogenase Eha subunit F
MQMHKHGSQQGRVSPPVVVAIALVILFGLIWYIGYRANYLDPRPTPDKGEETSFVIRTTVA